MNNPDNSLPYLQLDNVRAHYGKVTALDGLSLDIARGDMAAILGPSGCGKTTALNLIAGFIPVSSGSIRLDGQDMTNVPMNRRDTLMVFQSYALFPHMTVAANVAYGLQMRKIPKADCDRRVGEALDVVGLAHLRDRYPRALSGGQQQRVALARAIAPRPKLLLLDEPLSNLDAQLRRNLRSELRRIQQTLGITAVIVTHDREEALSMADTIAVLRNGRLEQTGHPSEVFERPRSLFVAQFIGQSNILRGKIASIEPRELTVQIGESVIRTRRDERLTYSPGADAAIVVRPARVRISKGAASDNQLNGTVISEERIGDALRLSVRIEAGDQEIDVERYLANDEAVPSVGAPTPVSFDPSDAWTLPPGE